MKLLGRILLSAMGALLGTLVAVWYLRYRNTDLLPDGSSRENDPSNWIALE